MSTWVSDEAVNNDFPIGTAIDVTNSATNSAILLISDQSKSKKDAATNSTANSRNKRANDARVNDVFGWFRTGWENKYKQRWIPEPGISRTIASVIKGMGEDNHVRLEAAIKNYLSTNDNWLARDRHPLRLLLQNPSKYLTAPTAVDPGQAAYLRYCASIK